MKKTMIKNKLKGSKSYAFVVDGECEKWYLETLQSEEKQLNAHIKPELFQKKTPKEQSKNIKKLVNDGYDLVFWIIDFDVINKEQKEAKRGNNQINNLKKIIYELLKQCEGKVRIIINNPCLEYWFLLHNKKTTKFYEDYDAILPDLKKYILLKDYKKTEKYYKQSNNIYKRLKTDQPKAIINAQQLDCDDFWENTQKGLSQMYIMFSDIL